MMMKKKIFLLWIVLFTTTSFADQQQGRISEDQDGMEKEKRIEQLATELGLTEEQKTKITASREKYKPQISSLEASFKSAREKFTAAVENPNASIGELESAYRQKEDAQRSLQDAIFKSRMDFREVLTPEQRTKMIAKRELSKDKAQGNKENRREKNNSKSKDAVPAPGSTK
jgi:Spy/CpxP family protein refolding chaperone